MEINKKIALKGPRHVLLTLLCLAFSLGRFSQVSETSSRIPYQAVARDASGATIANESLVIRTAMTGVNRDAHIYYAEQHRITTDSNGYFSLEIGGGKVLNGDWEEIPWYLGSLWLDIEIQASDKLPKPLISRTELGVVPYAFTAKTAQRLETAKDIDPRTTFSIHWNTSGNYKTVPHVHFIGTSDNQDFYIKTQEKTRIVFSKRGQMTIYAEKDKGGSEEEIKAHQLYVKGQEHGIYINLKESRSSANNYLTFADNGKIRGAIEGQTRRELRRSAEFIHANIDFGVTLALQIAVTAAEIVQSVGYGAAAAAAGATIVLSWKTPGYGTAAAATGVLSGLAVANSIAIAAQIAEYNINTLGSVGVAYSSGGADYAEYLKRNIEERDLFPGEIVGVRGGEISLNTDHADHYMVVSTAPAILGNLPSPERKELFEKVAFMGQVPVKVQGSVQAGDYILPSGKNDGIGIAVHPAELPTQDFKHIVGVAWETKNTTVDWIHQVNISVGIHQNDLAPRVQELGEKVDNMLAFLEGKEALKDFDQGITQRANSTSNQPTVIVSDEFLDELLERGAPTIEMYYNMLDNKMLQEGINLRDDPVWGKILEDPVDFIKTMRKDPNVSKRWVTIAQNIYLNSH